MPETIMGANGQQLHLGRLPPDPTQPKLRFGYYLDGAAAIEPPKSLDLTDKAQAVIKRMYLNDRYGICVYSGKAHSVGMMTAEDDGTPRMTPDNELYNHYQRVCGRGDNGCVITEVLNDMKAGRFTMDGKPVKLDAYAAVDNTNATMAKVAMILFGPLTLGLDLPQGWGGGDEIWDVNAGRIVGGHDVCTAGYDEKYVLISSWGKIYKMTWAAFTARQYVGEVWALMSPEWYGADEIAPGGYNLAKLKADFALIEQGRVPEIDPPAVFYDFGNLA